MRSYSYFQQVLVHAFWTCLVVSTFSTCVGVKRKRRLYFALPYLWALISSFMNSLFACTCSSQTLCTSGGNWTVFPFQGRYTAEDLPARSTGWKGMHHLHFCSFTCSLREGDGGEGMVFGLYLIKGERAVKNSWCNVSLTQGRTIYRCLQYLPEGTWEQSGAVLHKAGWEHTCALTAVKVKARACLTVRLPLSFALRGEETDGLLLKARS